MSTPPLFETDELVLPAPRLPDRATLGAALHGRHSQRSFASQPLHIEDLSALLWSAFGVNRPGSGGRTAPSAHGWQEVDVYAVLPEGAYRYDAQPHRLVPVKGEDLRPLTELQDFVGTAPLNLVYVVDFARMQGVREEDRTFLAGADTGAIVENVYLYCAGAGLATVVRGLVDRKRLARALGLSPTQRIALAQTVGYPLAPEPTH